MPRRAEDVRPDDDSLAYLPMAWAGDSVYTLVINLIVGFAVNCPESPETVQRDLRELGPDDGARASANLGEHADVDPGAERRRASPQALGLRAVPRAPPSERRSCGPRTSRCRLGCGSPAPSASSLCTVPCETSSGCAGPSWALTGGAPLGPDTFRFFRAFGVNLKQVYGSTETTGLVSLQPNVEANPTTAGRPCPGIEVKIADRGEVLVRGPVIFKGYFKNDEATAEVIDREGWFHTGDAGFIDPRGHLVIIDRAKDVGTLADGTPFAPQFIENKLKFSPYIREAVAFGHDKSFVAAMVAIDLNTVGNWAERRGVSYTSYIDLSQNPEVRALIRDEIGKGNETLPEATQVRRFLLLTKDLDADDAEMTRTRKVRRRFIAEKYADVIDGLLHGRDRGRPDLHRHLRGWPSGHRSGARAHRGRPGRASPCLTSSTSCSSCSPTGSSSG